MVTILNINNIPKIIDIANNRCYNIIRNKKEVQIMKTKEYLITFKNNLTLKVVDEFYINATDFNNALQIADDLRHEYKYLNYFEISASVETA